MRTRILPPAPVSITKPSLTGTMAGLCWANAECAKGASVRPTTPPNAPFSIDLRFMAGDPERSNTGNHVGAVPDAFHLHARLVQQREMQIGNRRTFGQLDLLPSLLERARAATDQDVRQRIIAVQVAVAHVGAVEQHR